MKVFFALAIEFGERDRERLVTLLNNSKGIPDSEGLSPRK
jgi:hypothetical protein